MRQQAHSSAEVKLMMKASLRCQKSCLTDDEFVAARAGISVGLLALVEDEVLNLNLVIKRRHHGSNSNAHKRSNQVSGQRSGVGGGRTPDCRAEAV